MDACVTIHIYGGKIIEFDLYYSWVRWFLDLTNFEAALKDYGGSQFFACALVNNWVVAFKSYLCCLCLPAVRLLHLGGDVWWRSSRISVFQGFSTRWYWIDKYLNLTLQVIPLQFFKFWFLTWIPHIQVYIS